MPSEASFSSGSLLAGKYRVIDLLGQGGMGAVYLAENVDIGRQVAIKVLKPELAADPNSLARFKQEARAAASIGHPGIIEVFDMGMLPEGGAFIVMERLEGQTLREKLAREGSLYPGDAVALVGEVLETLAAAHDKGVIHRDLKPDNIFLVAQPVAATKILDFGISKFRGTGDVALTRTGMVMGTPLYMSPEQARGSRDVGVAADLYSIGAILYEALSGQPPFPGESYNEVLAKVLMDTARPLGQLRPDVPVELANLIEGMLAKDPAARPPSAREAAARLRASVPAGFQPSTAPPRGTSSTFIRPTPPPPMAAHQTGPKPASDMGATYTPPPRPPTGLPDTQQRPPHANAHLPTAEAVVVAQPVQRGGGGKKVALLIGAGFAVLIAVGVGISLGQRSVLEPAQVKIERARIGDQDVTIGTGPDGIAVHMGDGEKGPSNPGGLKIEIGAGGVKVEAQPKAAEAPDAGALAVKSPEPQKPSEQPTAEAPGEPAEPAPPARHGTAKSGARQTGYKAGGAKKPKGGMALPGFNPDATYR